MNEFLKRSDVSRSVIVLLVLLSVFVLVQSINSLKENKFIGVGDSSVNTISVSGKGEVAAIPDIATFSFSVSEEATEVKEAQDAISKKIDEALTALKDLGIDKKDLNTLSYNIYPRYEYYQEQRICPNGFACPPTGGERVLVGYEASQTVSVKVRKIERAGEVLEVLGSTDVSNINGPSFDIENRDELMREARKEAIDDAKDKAETLAKDLGVKLVRVVSFYEGNNYNYAYAKAQSFDEELGYGTDGGSYAPEIPVGESEIISTVEIIYEIK